MNNIRVIAINEDVFRILNGNKEIGYINYNHDTGNYDGADGQYGFENAKNKQEAINKLVNRQ